MIHFQVRDLLSLLFYRLLGRVFRAFAAFGRGVRLERPLHIVGARHIHFGDRVAVQNGAYLNAATLRGSVPAIVFGNDAQIGHHVHIVCSDRVEIAERVLMADRVFIADCGHAYADPRRAIVDQELVQLAPVMIGAGSWIGENACIIGCRIGENCVIAANSVVTRDIPDRTVAAGAPARPIRRWCDRREAWIRTDAAGAFVE
ncbi:MAG: acyltransferase [Pseudomonadota bacterium]